MHDTTSLRSAGYEGYNTIVYEVDVFLLKTIDPQVCTATPPTCAQCLKRAQYRLGSAHSFTVQCQLRVHVLHLNPPQAVSLSTGHVYLTAQALQKMLRANVRTSTGPFT
jgi:hypothetical protein